MADAYIKTFDIDETFTMEDTNDGADIMMFHLPSDNNPLDMFLWGSAFVPHEFLNTDGLYAWVSPMPMDSEGDVLDNMYSNAGVLCVVTNFSTYNDPTQVRLKGTVKVMYLPVVEVVV